MFDGLDDLPKTIPVFPLDGVLLLPGGQLPLNLFEPRYLAMLNDVLGKDRLIGMIQPLPGQTNQDDTLTPRKLHSTGCVGRVTGFQETDNGRYLITLTGLCRFHIKKELMPHNGYRVVQPDWKPFAHDYTAPASEPDIDRTELEGLLRAYFAHEELDCDWSKVADTPDDKLITCLSMICPFSGQEKQALLEARCPADRAEKFIALLRITVLERQGGGESSLN